MKKLLTLTLLTIGLSGNALAKTSPTTPMKATTASCSA